MPTIREATFDLFRAHGMTTIFGNPGSTELPMLADYPDDFNYVLALQELVVVGIADGYAQASGRPAHVNLHTAPGVGNAVGGISNAQLNKSPLVITAGQQVRPQMEMEALLTNRDAVFGPLPYVKWSHEPARPQDVPAAIGRAIHLALMPPQGPVFVSIPMDDWNAEAEAERAGHVIARRIASRMRADEGALAELAGRLQEARRPALIVGPGNDGEQGWAAAVRLAEQQRLAVWASPATGGGRLGFPENHPQFLGVLPPAIGPLGHALEGYDLAIVAGSSVFPYYPYMPGPLLPDGLALVQLTNDPAEAARAPMGDAILGDVPLALERLGELAGDSDRQAPEPRPGPPEPEAMNPISGSQAMAALADAWPQDGIALVETPSSLLAVRNRLRISRPDSWFYTASGGLGFAISAAVGVQLAQPSRPVICVIGEGSAQYGITALWSAAAYHTPVTFLVLRNQEYAILKWFAGLEQVTGVPGLDLPALDVAAVARSYGVPARDVSSREELTEALREDIAVADGPRLIQVGVAGGIWGD